MKNLNILSLLIIVALLLGVQPATAVVSVQNTQETTSTTISKKELKKQERMEKMMDKIQKKMDKMESKGLDRNDPVGKWLWLAIIFWVIAIILYILAALTLGVFWWLAYLASLLGTIFFIIWLLKFLEVM